MKKSGTKSIEPMLKGGHTLVITPQAWRKMLGYTKAAATEVGWLGFVERTPDNPLRLVLMDVVLPKQQAHGSTTEIQPEHMSELYAEWEQAYDTAYAFDHMERINLWGHSHVNMSPTPSGQDDTTFDKFKQGGKPMFVRLIMNKGEDVHVDVADTEYNMLTKAADVVIEAVTNNKLVITTSGEAEEDIIEFEMDGAKGWTLSNIGEEAVLIHPTIGVVLRNVVFETAQKFTDKLQPALVEAVRDRVIPFGRTRYSAGYLGGSTTTNIGNNSNITPLHTVTGATNSAQTAREKFAKMSNYTILRILYTLLYTHQPSRDFVNEMREVYAGTTLNTKAVNKVRRFAKQNGEFINNVLLELNLSYPDAPSGYERSPNSGAFRRQIDSAYKAVITASANTLPDYDLLGGMVGREHGHMHMDFFHALFHVLFTESAKHTPQVDVAELMAAVFLDKHGSAIFNTLGITNNIIALSQDYHSGRDYSGWRHDFYKAVTVALAELAAAGGLGFSDEEELSDTELVHEAFIEAGEQYVPIMTLVELETFMELCEIYDNDAAVALLKTLRERAVADAMKQ